MHTLEIKKSRLWVLMILPILMGGPWLIAGGAGDQGLGIIPATDVQLRGEMGRRIDQVIQKNLWALEVLGVGE